VDNIIITSMSCARPINLIANNITTQSANISWTETGNSTSWYLYYKPYDAFNYDSILVSNNPSYTLNNLIPNKEYLVYIKSNCNNQLSHSSEIFNFNTQCSTISSLPFTEDFNIYFGGLVPYCWNRIDSYTDDPFNQSVYHSYPRSLRFYTAMDEYNYSILPEIDASIPVNSLMLSFWMKKSNFNSRLIIGVMDSLDINSFVPIDTVAPSDTTNWEEFEINLNSYSAAGSFIVFKSEYNSEANYAYIDDIYLDYIPSCARPNSVSITPITETSVSVNFTAVNNSNNQWWVYYKPISDTYWDSILTNQNSATLNNLSLQTSYQIYIKTLCEDTIYSAPTSILTYTTPCITYPIASFPWIESFENGINCWEQEIVSGGTNWTAEIDNTSSHSGLNYALLNNTIGNRTKLISQTLDISLLNRPYLSFWHKQYTQADYYNNYQDSLKVYYRSDTNNTTEWVELFNFNSNIPFYRRDSIALPNSSSTYQIAFEGYGGGGQGVFLDDIKVYDSVPCIIPQSLSSVPSNNSVTLSWNAGGNENTWEVRLGENGVTQTTNNNSNFQITGLSSGTTYIVYIRSVCGATHSSWVQTSFTTIQFTEVTTIPPSNITQTSATFIANFIEGTWSIDSIGFEYRKTNNTNWEILPLSNIVTPFSYHINSLSPNTSYMVRAYVVTFAEGKVYGDSLEFTTLQVVEPIVSTGVPSVESNQVTFIGTIIQGSESINSRGFEYKLLLENWTEAVDISAEGIENIFAVVEGFQLNNYEVRAYTRTETDKYYGDTIAFTTINLINLEGENISLILYPNPAREETELVIIGLNEEIKITIIDLYGRILNTMFAKPNNRQIEKKINLSNLTKGVYYIKIENKDINRTQKLIIN
ncbi:MAG: fibronectin type III domain-containing protein, partial [Bacilli bacterium]|nr:fibronectin type III domain-containing protein [Bacilli bacterium]